MTDAHDADDFWEAESESLGSAIWVDPRTGELVEKGTKGAVLVEASDPQHLDARPDRDWLPDWYTKRLAEWAAQEALLERQHLRRLAQLRADRASFQRWWRERVEDCVRADAAARKRRSVDYAYGRLGWRRKPAKREVTDEQQALCWAHEHCPKAVKVSESILKSQLPEGDVPGTKIVPAHDSFYADVKP